MPKRPTDKPTWVILEKGHDAYALQNAPCTVTLFKGKRGWWSVCIFFNDDFFVRKIRPGRGVDPFPVALFAARQMLTAMLAPYNKFAGVPNE